LLLADAAVNEPCCIAEIDVIFVHPFLQIFEMPQLFQQPALVCLSTMGTFDQRAVIRNVIAAWAFHGSSPGYGALRRSRHRIYLKYAANGGFNV